MPRGDGTGPLGIGPTGWGRGMCVGPRGGGFGFGFGPGRGMRGWGWAMPYRQAIPDAELLEERAEMLERQAAACRNLARKAKETDPEKD